MSDQDYNSPSDSSVSEPEQPRVRERKSHRPPKGIGLPILPQPSPYWHPTYPPALLTLPFGLAPAPLVFTKLLRPVVAFLRQRGVRLVVYLDDFLLMAETQKLLRQQVEMTSSLLTSLGFLLNVKKCSLDPSTRLEFLGFVVDSTTLSLYVPLEKNKKIKKECRHILNKESVSARQLAHIIGLLSSVTPAVLPAPLHYRGLQRLRSKALKASSHRNLDYDTTVLLSKEAQDDLSWWTSYSFVEGRPLQWPQAALSIESDASKTGWGAHLLEQQQTIGGVWSREEAKCHINWLELQAAFIGIQSFAQNRSNIHIHLLIDNTVAIAYLNRMGGTKSYPLCQLALLIWNWCLERKITLHADHIPGQMNTRADFASRHWHDSSDWMLDPVIFNRLEQKFGQFSIDLFASSHNAQLPVFFSWKPDPKALAVDALSQGWNHLRLPYAFPPFALIGRTLQKILKEVVSHLILIAPVWPAQHWYPLLLEMLSDYPVLLPHHNDLILDYHRQSHPLILNGHLSLAAWPVSGNHYQTATFQRSLSPFTMLHGEAALQSPTTQHGTCGPAGVSKGQLIPFLHL